VSESFKYSRPLATWLQQNVQQFDIAHIHAVFNHSSMAAASACRRQEVPYIVRPLGTLDPWGMKQKAWRKGIYWHLIAKNVLKNAAAVHYTSNVEKEAVETTMGLNQGCVVPLGVEVNEFGAAELAPDVIPSFPELSQAPYILVLARLHPIKGLDTLIKAFLRVRRDPKFSAWRLLLAGEGPRGYVDHLRKTITTGPDSGNVILTGWLEGDLKMSMLRRASLLVLPSHHENFGVCVVEALASGVPVLVSRAVNLAAEIRAANAGWIASVEIESLVEALREALNSEDERLRRGRNAKKLARKFDWSVIAADLSIIYRRLLVQR
jgi:glycosyltransferase involved in cell wall biosynthesis